VVVKNRSGSETASVAVEYRRVTADERPRLVVHSWDYEQTDGSDDPTTIELATEAQLNKREVRDAVTD
jgi:hypothetical protein